MIRELLVWLFNWLVRHCTRWRVMLVIIPNPKKPGKMTTRLKPTERSGKTESFPDTVKKPKQNFHG